MFYVPMLTVSRNVKRGTLLLIFLIPFIYLICSRHTGDEEVKWQYKYR